MYVIKMGLLSSSTSSLNARGGLTQVLAQQTLAPVQATLNKALESSHTDEDYFFWASDEGILYPEALLYRWKIPLSRFLLVQARDASEVWRLGLEASQTGLFRLLFLRASRLCHLPLLRKLQLCAEKNQCDVFILTHTPLPHWTLKKCGPFISKAHTL